jgi:hypothetical protein
MPAKSMKIEHVVSIILRPGLFATSEAEPSKAKAIDLRKLSTLGRAVGKAGLLLIALGWLLDPGALS